MTITDFLLARIVEDETAARAVGAEGQWDAATEGWWGALSDHAERHDPARVLADCEAKRRIVDKFDQVDDRGTDHELGYGLHFALTALASIYSDHPDFDASWA